MATTRYTVNWKGNTVLNMLPVSASPESGAKPLYDRKPIINYEPSRL